jgi:hypothetical protein
VYNVDRFHADHFNEVKYEMRRPEQYARKLKPAELMVHERPVTLTYSRPPKPNDVQSLTPDAAADAAAGAVST